MIEPIARIRIELRSVEPHVWRRVDVPLSCTLLALHDIIQIAMGWTDSHLFEFQVGDRLYGTLEFDPELLEPRQYKASRIRLRTLIERGVHRFEYIYDFGDYWQHDVVITSTWSPNPLDHHRSSLVSATVASINVLPSGPGVILWSYESRDSERCSTTAARRQGQVPRPDTHRACSTLVGSSARRHRSG